MFKQKRSKSDIYGVKHLTDVPGDHTGQASDGELTSGSAIWHSKHYLNYFSGYSELRIDKPRGGYKVQRFYTAPWIQQDTAKVARWQVRLVYWLLYLLAAALFVTALVMPYGSNYCVYVAIPGFPTATIAFITLAVLINYSFAKKNMTLWEHKSTSSRIQLFSLVFACALAATAAAKLLYLFMDAQGSYGGEMLSIGMCLAAAAASLAINRIEGRLNYIKVPNDTKAPVGSVELRK